MDLRRSTRSNHLPQVILFVREILETFPQPYNPTTPPIRATQKHNPTTQPNHTTHPRDPETQPTTQYAPQVILFVREILETFPHLRESVMKKLLQTFPAIHSSRVARVALWCVLAPPLCPPPPYTPSPVTPSATNDLTNGHPP